MEQKEYVYDVHVPQLVVQMDMNVREEWTKIPEQYYTGAILDCEYKFDGYAHRSTHGALEAGQFKEFLDKFKAKTLAPDWVVMCFCGHLQAEPFLQVAQEFCHGNAERMFWVKSATHGNLKDASGKLFAKLESEMDTPTKYPNAVETFIMCYYVKDATPTGP